MNFFLIFLWARGNPKYRLQVKSKIAEGGFACIYQATNESSGETLAVKRLLSNDAERKQDAIREASLLRKMNHKNIVKFVTGKKYRGYHIRLYHLVIG